MAYQFFELRQPTFEGAPPTAVKLPLVDMPAPPQVGQMVVLGAQDYMVNIIRHNGLNTEVYLVPAKFNVAQHPEKPALVIT